MDPDTLSTRLIRVMRRDGPGAARNLSNSHVPGEVVDDVLDIDCSTIGIAITTATGEGSLIITAEAARHLDGIFEVEDQIWRNFRS